MKPEKRNRYQQFIADDREDIGEYVASLPERMFEKAYGRISFEASEILTRLEPKLEAIEAQESTAEDMGEVYQPTLQQRTLLWTGNVLDAIVYGSVG